MTVRAVAAHLAAGSHALFLNEWRRMGYASENYSAITGTADDERLSRAPLHSWGALLGMIALVEAGKVPAPEQALEKASDR